MKFNPIVPELYVSDIDKSLDFYKWLGFEIKYDRPEKRFAFIEREGGQIMLCERNGTWETAELVYPFGRGINLEIGTENVEALCEKVNSTNYPIFEELSMAEYRQGNNVIRQQEFLIQDPDGFLLRFSSSK